MERDNEAAQAAAMEAAEKEEGIKEITAEEAETFWYEIPKEVEDIDDKIWLTNEQVAQCLKAFYKDNPGVDENGLADTHVEEAREQFSGRVIEIIKNTTDSWERDNYMGDTDPTITLDLDIEALEEHKDDWIMDAHGCIDLHDSTDVAVGRGDIEGTKMPFKAKIDFAAKTVEIGGDFIEKHTEKMEEVKKDLEAKLF